MKQIEISEKTFIELTKLARPLIDDADTVISNIIRHYKKHHGISSKRGAVPPAVTTKIQNSDKLKNYLLNDYKDMGYVHIIRKIFKESKQSRLNLWAIVNSMFKFPKDNKTEERKERAAKSILSRIRQNPDTFSEPNHKIFKLN